MLMNSNRAWLVTVKELVLRLAFYDQIAEHIPDMSGIVQLTPPSINAGGVKKRPMYTTHALPCLVLPCLGLREVYRLELLTTSSHSTV